MERCAPVVVGLISDTHGLLRADVHEALKGVSVILHAGDVCGDEILDELNIVAPTFAVYGNCDDPWNPRLTKEIVREIAGLRIHVSHGHELGVPTPDKLLATYDADVLVYGHTHRQLVVQAGGRLVVNPGAAGPRRFDLKPSVARLTIVGGKAGAEIVNLQM